MDGEVRRETVKELEARHSRRASTPPLARGAIVGARWQFLAEASAVLDSSLDYKETLANVVRLVVPRMADYAAIGLLGDDGALSWGYAEHRDSAKAPLVKRLLKYQPQLSLANNPTAAALRSGTTQIFETVDDAALCSIARDPDHLATVRELGPTSLIFLRLAARDRALGMLVLATTRDSDRHYCDRDVAIANEVARRAALAVDHALLFRAAEQASRAREEVVAVVSHDLKNPLSTIQMAVSFLLDELVADDEAHRLEREQLRAIRRSAERMYRLIHDLLDVAAIEAGQLRVEQSPVAVEVLVSDAAELLRPLAAAKRIELTINLAPALPFVAADRERILQVFSNLGGNAIKFTPQEGRVEIRAAARDAAVEFSVCDSGPGISAEDVAHVFDRFWQAKKASRAGVGLGLAIAQGIVQAHRGAIRVESAPGRGSCFVFTLPVLPAGANPVPTT